MCVCDALACKHDISRRVTVTELILGVWVGHIEKMIPIVFGGGQRSFGVRRGQNVKTL
ncbi:hypothetical protein HOLleu_28989 [Holothuria leucospilota]|uniref:Uncharacterized protein n=1 Tax=Holothuria leucospilota TaxID=206669 RepID=A0A9Q1BN21_HOLLE|nr:hypothetical protein HOLleu_28989 [Holothuria leucospilota]